MSELPWRILVADDDPTAGLLAQAVLGGTDFAPTLVDNGCDALAEFQRTSFDMALLDVEMPGMNGFEVCEAIRRSHGPNFPVVLVTSHGDPAFFEKAHRLSADYLAKPVNWQSLPGLLRSLMAASRG